MSKEALTYTHQIERDDLRLFFNACLSATSQSEKESHAFSQRIGLDFLHTYIRVNYREIYALMGTLAINDHNRQRIIAGLLSHPKKETYIHENAHIFKALNLLPVHRAYKLFAQLAENHINNRRTRRIICAYIKQRNNLYFDIIKYRRLLRIVLRHIHYPLADEPYTFLFHSAWKQRTYTHPLLESFRQAHFSEKAIYTLPFSIAEGLAARKNIPRERFLKHIVPQLSAHEAWRLQNTLKKANKQTALTIRPERQSLMQLLLYGLSHPSPESEGHLKVYFEKNTLPPKFAHMRIATVLDNSYSTMGSRERKRRPLATALGVDLYFKHVPLLSYKGFWVSPKGVNSDALFQLKARGPTALAAPLIQALKGDPDWIIIVSDGCENAPAKGVEWVLRQVKKHKLLNKMPFILHLNPVWNSSQYQPRQLAEGMVTLGVREIETLPTLMAFAQFFQGQSPQAGLIKYISEGRQ